MIGRKIGQYEIVEEIGRGGMGTVYRARQLSLGRDVAVKVLLSHQALDPKGLERFKREGAVVAQVAHPNIVQIIDVGEQDGLHYIVMEFVKGRTVASVLKEAGALGFRDAVYICSQVASALGALHAKGLVHRDIKPSNIMLADEFQAKLADFGVASLADQPEGERLTITQAAVGTPYYMSPEQVKGLRTVDGASDVYSLGVVLYEMLAGKHPFGDATPSEAMIKQVNEPFAPIRRYRGDIPDDVERVLGRCLAKDKEERFADGTALHKALEKLRLRLEMVQMEEMPQGDDYRARMTGTGLFYVDLSQAGEIKAKIWFKALCAEMIAQVRDPNKKARRALNKLYAQTVIAREKYKSGEKDIEELQKRQKYHDDKASALAQDVQKLVSQGQADEVDAATDKEAHHQKMAVDYRHQAEELGPEVKAARETYDSLRERHAKDADELALLDTEARRAGKLLSVCRENPRLARQARLARQMLVCLGAILVCAGLVWAYTRLHVPSPAPVSVPAPPTQPVAPPPVQAKAVEVPSKGLVLYYSFDNDSGTTVLDDSGNKNNGSHVGTIAYENGFIGKAPRFTSSGTYVLCSSPELNCNGWKGITVSAWVLMKDYTTYGKVVARGATSGRTVVGYTISVGGASNGTWNRGHFSTANGPKSESWVDSVKTFANGVTPWPEKGRWYHIVGTCDSTSRCYYVDGALDSRQTWDGPLSLWDDPNSKLIIGNGSMPQTAWSDAYFNGLIDEVRIYDRALSSDEVAQLHGSASKGLVLHYTFDDGGTTVKDKSGNGNNGHVVGPVPFEQGVSGKAPRFSGASTYVVMDDPGLKMNGWKQATISIWAMVKEPTTYGHVVGSGGMTADRPGGFGIALGTGYNRGQFAVFTGPNKPQYLVAKQPAPDGKTSLDRDTWYHVVGTYDGKAIRYYVNGVLAGYSDVMPEDQPLWDDPDNKTTIGIYPNPNGFTWSDNSFHGLVDEVRVYDRALSSTEVAQLHSETAALLKSVLEFGGHYYEFVGEEVEWEVAEATAVRKGGHLAIVNSPEENAFIASHIPNGFNWLWLGGTDRQQEGVWKWVDGTLMSSGYQNWGPNSPDNGAPDDGQDFLIMRLDDPHFSAGGKWDDTDYSAIPSPDYVIAYVIEYNKAP